MDIKRLISPSIKEHYSGQLANYTQEEQQISGFGRASEALAHGFQSIPVLGRGFAAAELVIVAASLPFMALIWGRAALLDKDPTGFHRDTMKGVTRFVILSAARVLNPDEISGTAISVTAGFANMQAALVDTPKAVDQD